MVRVKKKNSNVWNEDKESKICKTFQRDWDNNITQGGENFQAPDQWLKVLEKLQE